MHDAPRRQALPARRVRQVRTGLNQLVQGAWRRQALPTRRLRQVRRRQHAVLRRARGRPPLPAEPVHQIRGGPHAVLQGARRRQALPVRRLHQVRGEQHAVLHLARRQQAGDTKRPTANRTHRGFGGRCLSASRASIAASMQFTWSLLHAALVVVSQCRQDGCAKAAHSSKMYCGTHGGRGNGVSRGFDVGALSAMEALDHEEED
jgi:hypothetical protein